MKNLKRILESQREELKQLELASLCTRKEEQELQLDSNLAQVVIGVRRSGKSTLCQKVLIEKGVNFAYVNFDDERLRKAKTDDLDDVLQMLYEIYGDFTHLFFDEVQNVKDWPLFVNRLLRQILADQLRKVAADLVAEGKLAVRKRARARKASRDMAVRLAVHALLRLYLRAASVLDRAPFFNDDNVLFRAALQHLERGKNTGRAGTDNKYVRFSHFKPSKYTCGAYRRIYILPIFRVKVKDIYAAGRPAFTSSSC